MGFYMDITLAGVAFTDEKWSSVGASSFKLSHDWFLGDDIVIRDAVGGGGNLLVVDTDYSLITQNTQLTSDAGADVYQKIQVTNAAYQAVDLYISGKYVGDSVQAEDFYPGAVGQLTARIYNDAGTLKVTKGFIGIDDGTLKGVYEEDTVTTISMAAVSNSNWAKIELAISGNNYIYTAADIAGSTDPGVIPSTFTGAFVPEKGGFYITATKRCIGLAWKNAGGTLEGIVNCLPFIDGYQGYSISDDALDQYYRWEKINENTVDSNYVGRLHMIPEDERPSSWVVDAGNAIAYTDIDFSAYVPYGVKAVILRGYCFINTADTLLIYFRQNGSTIDAVARIGIGANGTATDGGDTNRFPFTITCLCDSDGIVEYKVSDADGDIYINIDGYYLPENAG